MAEQGRRACQEGRGRASIRDAFEPCCNIDAIAEDIVVVDDDVSQMDADAELDPLGLGYLRVLVSHAALNFDGASRCIDGTGKFDAPQSPHFPVWNSATISDPLPRFRFQRKHSLRVLKRKTRR